MKSNEISLPSWRAMLLSFVLLMLGAWGFTNLQSYFQPGVFVEYDAGGFKEFQRVYVDADVRRVYIKKITSDRALNVALRKVVSRDAHRVSNPDPGIVKSTIALPHGAAFTAIIIGHSGLGDISLLGVFTPKGVEISFPGNGITLYEGVYSVSNRDEIAPKGMFTVSKGAVTVGWKA